MSSGDLQIALGGIPGIAVTPGSGGGTSHTIAGLNGDQNRVTLNGADVAPAATRDGGLLRVSTSGYDPTEAMSGVRSEWIILGANYVPNRRLRLTFDAPGLPANLVATALGHRSAAPVLSGVFGGPGKGFLRFHNTSFQISVLRRLGRDARVNRRCGAGRARGEPGFRTAAGQGARRARHRVARIAPCCDRSGDDERECVRAARLHDELDRRDLPGPNETVGGQSSGGQGHVFYLLVGADAAETRGAGVGALTLPAYASSSRSRGFTAQAFNSVYPREHILNETRLSVTVSGSRSEPDSPLPAAAVLMSTSGDQGGTLRCMLPVAAARRARCAPGRCRRGTTRI